MGRTTCIRESATDPRPMATAHSIFVLLWKRNNSTQRSWREAFPLTYSPRSVGLLLVVSQQVLPSDVSRLDTKLMRGKGRQRDFHSRWPSCMDHGLRPSSGQCGYLMLMNDILCSQTGQIRYAAAEL